MRQPYEQNPFLVYGARFQRKLQLKPVDVKYMTMVKFHEDFIRYDFYYNCTDLLWFTDKHEHELSDEYDETDLIYSKYFDVLPSAATTADANNDTDSYPIISKYLSKQFNTLKYDVLHVFQDSYQIYEKSHKIVGEDSSDDYDDNQKSANAVNAGQSSDKANDETSKSKGFSGIIKKAIVGLGSFLFMGVLKFICSLDFVKNLMKEAAVDDDKAKDLRKSVSNVVNKNVADSLGLELDD